MSTSESKHPSYPQYYSQNSYYSPQAQNKQLSFTSGSLASPSLPSPPSIPTSTSQQVPTYYYPRMYELPSATESSPQPAVLAPQRSPQATLAMYQMASPPHFSSSSPSTVQSYASHPIVQSRTPQSATFAMPSSMPSSMQSTMQSTMQSPYAPPPPPPERKEYIYTYEHKQSDPKQWSPPMHKHTLPPPMQAHRLPQFVQHSPRSHPQNHKHSNSKERPNEVHIQPSMTGRARRRSTSRATAEVSYPTYYPAHAVPPEMQIPTGPPESWTVTPPRPEEIRRRKYASGVDERNFFTVLEYEINSQPIIWDYYTGYVHLTGIWKAIGNSKADIVKLLDNSPELEPVIKRVRGGFLKIQGTWVPYEVARKLALHVCFYVRYALVPLFGATFPEQCTRPSEPGFGMLQLNAPKNLLESVHQEKPRTASTPSSRSPLVHLRSHSTNTPTHLDNAGSFVSHPHPSQVGSSSIFNSPRSLSSSNHSSLYHPTIFHAKSASDSGFKRRLTPTRNRTNSSSAIAAAAAPRRDSVNQALSINREAYDENVLVDEDAPCISPPPMPRKVSFSDERVITESPTEFLEMLKATRSLQQMSAGRFAKDVGGGFECGGRQFVWDGIDKLDVLPLHQTLNSKAATPPKLENFTSKPAYQPPSQTTPNMISNNHKPEPSPPLDAPVIDRRSPSLAKILNV